MPVFFKRAFPLALALFLAISVCAEAADKSARSRRQNDEFTEIRKGESAAAPVQVHGDTVEYFQEEQKAVGTGNVRIDHEGTQLSADKITVYTDKKVAVAEGNVTLVQEGSTYKGQRAEYDFGKKQGRVDAMSANLQDVYFGKARSVERIDAGHFRLNDAYVTTCCSDDPFYKVGAQSMDYFPGDRVEMRNAILYIKNIPVFFIPFYSQRFVDYDRFPVHLAAGTRSEWGPFILSRWRYDIVNRPDLQARIKPRLDYRAKRGIGGGADVHYKGDKIGRGTFRGYIVDDDKPPQDVRSERTRYQLRHQSKLAPDTTLTTEWNALSDKDVIKDFFYHEEYERDVNPDNYVSIIKATPDYTLSFLQRERVNEFYTVVERSPQLRFDTHNKPFMDTPFYLRQEVQFDNLKKHPANADFAYDAARFDERTTLSYAGRLGDVSITPRAGVRQTWYNREATGDRDLTRGVFEPGLDISTHFFKTYDTYWRALGLDVNQLRHVFTPSFSYNFRPNPTVSRTLIQQFDALDEIDKDNFVRINLENKLLTKSRGADGQVDPTSSREFARVLPYMDYDLRTGRLENVGVDAEFRPYTWLGIYGEATYNPLTRDWDTASVDIAFEKGRWRVAVGQRYIQEESSQSTLDIRFKLNEEWAFKIYERYEFEKNESKEFELTVSKAFDCAIADFTYNTSHDGGNTFFVSLRLKDHPITPYNLNQSYTPPKTLTAPAPATAAPMPEKM